MFDGFVGALLTLLAITNPFGAVPVYVALRGARDLTRHRDDAWRAGLTVTACLALFAVAGTMILAAFGVEPAALRASGGLIVTFMAFSMVQGDVPGTDYSNRDQQLASARPKDDLSVYVPLSMPLIAGPGAITTAITLAANPAVGLGNTLAAIVVVGLVVGLALAMAQLWYRLLGEFGLRLATRILGLVVMAVGVQMVVGGVRALWIG